jgi:hypothetical protein
MVTLEDSKKKKKLGCYFGLHEMKIQYYEGIYGGQVAYLACDNCDHKIFAWQGKRYHKKIREAVKEKNEFNKEEIDAS